MAARWRYLTPSLAIFTYLAICFAFSVGTAGLEEDEGISFRRAAGLADHARMQCLGSYDIRAGHACLPVMIAPYVGAAKDYVLLPMFFIAGVHVGVARMGTAMLAALGILGAWYFIRRFFGDAAAAVTAGFLALNPSYIDLPLFDQGNIAFSLGILGLLLIGVACVAGRESHLRIFVLGLLIGIGIWGRLNFVWLVFAAGLSMAVVFRADLRKRLRYLPALAAGSLVGATLLVRFLLRRSGDLRGFMETSAVPESFSQSFRSLFLTLRDVGLASAEHRVGIWHGGAVPTGVSTAMLLVAAMAVVWCFRRGKWALAVAGTVLVLLLEYLGSRLPVASHHMVIFVPLVALALGIAGGDLCFTRVGRAALGILCLAYAITAATINVGSASSLHRTRGYGEWSAGVYPLVAYLESHPDPNGLYLLDWGFEHSVALLSKGRVSSANLFDRTAVDWKGVVLRGGTFVTYEPGTLHFPEATILFEQALGQSKKAFTKESFQERDGAGYAFVYVVPRSGVGEELLPDGLTARETTFLAVPAEIVSRGEGLGKTTLMFWTDKSKLVEIHVGAPDGPMLGQFRSRGTTSGVAQTGDWVTDGMTFYLQDVAGKALTRQNTLATVRVSVTRAK